MQANKLQYDWIPYFNGDSGEEKLPYINTEK